jgi:hypothetical protein
VLDYLTDEVLLQQPANVQAFLLHTSVLDRLCGPLCDAVFPNTYGERASAQDTLERLNAANVFIVPLEGERKWYRYHHLFAELLRQRLAAGVPTSRRPCIGEPANVTHRRVGSIKPLRARWQRATMNARPVSFNSMGATPSRGASSALSWAGWRRCPRNWSAPAR